MGLLEPLTHKQEAQMLIEEAQGIYDRARDEMEDQKAIATKSLERLGKVKIAAWSEQMERFVTCYEVFNHVQIDKDINTDADYFQNGETPEQMLIEMTNTSANATEIAKAGVASVGTGALVGVAAYGGAMMFGTASTGTAIAALSGAAQTNALLAWFGGGAKVAGGLGMAAGGVVLAGIVVAPIVGVAAIIANAKGKERLAEANKILAQAKDAKEKMRTITAGLRSISWLSNSYADFIRKLGKKFDPVIDELFKISRNNKPGADGRIEYDSLSDKDKRTLHLAWLMAQIFFGVLNTPILNEDGEVSAKANITLIAAEEDSEKVCREIEKNFKRRIGEKSRDRQKNKGKRFIFTNILALIVLVAIGALLWNVNRNSAKICLICSVIELLLVYNWFRDGDRRIVQIVGIVIACVGMIAALILI